MLSTIPRAHTRGGSWVEKSGRADLPMGRELALGHQLPHKRSSDGFLANAANEPFIFSELAPLPFKLPTALYYRVALGSNYAECPIRLRKRPIPALMAWRSILSPRSRLR
jgi:hypothetical protein